MLKLVQKLFLRTSDDPAKVVMFTGADCGCGCTSVCAGAAEALAAQVDESVCVLDANLRFPALHYCFSARNDIGLTDAIASSDPIGNFAQQLQGDNLWFISAGSKMSTAFPSIRRVTDRITELRNRFGYVLIDTSPVNSYAEAMQFGQLSDGAVLVLASDATRKEAARRAKESLESAQVRLLGAVLNKRTFPIPGFIYSRI
jgi:Mrp family chromosome partitioning ATPase